MVKPIMRDIIFLAQKSVDAQERDAQTAQDLLDTLRAHRDGCVGMAANMIGVNKRIIAFDDGGKYTVMFNPVIIKQSGAYEAEEGCLSLSGTRKTTRYKNIRVQYQNEQMQTRIKNYSGFTAEIIQHEIDHCLGILIWAYKTNSAPVQKIAIVPGTSGAPGCTMQVEQGNHCLMTKEFDMAAPETVTNRYLGGDSSLVCSAPTYPAKCAHIH